LLFSSQPAGFNRQVILKCSKTSPARSCQRKGPLPKVPLAPPQELSRDPHSRAEFGPCERLRSQEPEGPAVRTSAAVGS